MQQQQQKQFDSSNKAAAKLKKYVEEKSFSMILLKSMPFKH